MYACRPESQHLRIQHSQSCKLTRPQTQLRTSYIEYHHSLTHWLNAFAWSSDTNDAAQNSTWKQSHQILGWRLSCSVQSENGFWTPDTVQVGNSLTNKTNWNQMQPLQKKWILVSWTRDALKASEGGWLGYQHHLYWSRRCGGGELGTS